MEQSKRQREKDSSSSCHGSVICFYNITKPHHFISTWNHDFFGFTRYLKVWLLYFSVSALKKLTDIRHDTLDSHNEQYISLVKTMTWWLTQIIIIIKKRNTKVNLKNKTLFFCTSTNGYFGHDPFIAALLLYPDLMTAVESRSSRFIRKRGRPTSRGQSESSVCWSNYIKITLSLYRAKGDNPRGYSKVVSGKKSFSLY